MVTHHLVGRGLSDAAVLRAMLTVPREAFVPPEQREFAYRDAPLPIGEGQTISQPFIVASMAEALSLRPTDRVLEVGTGSGYGAAVLSRVAAEVFTIERHPALAETARRRLEALAFANVHVRCGDGTLGMPERAPFDAIAVTAGGPVVPDTLLEQLAIGGRLVIPVGADLRKQRLLKITRVSASRYERKDLGAVLFVPLVGAFGWGDPGPG